MYKSGYFVLLFGRTRWVRRITNLADLRSDCSFSAGIEGVMFLSELKEVIADPCGRHPVKSLKVFGSVARGESGEGSDLDLLVQFEEMPPAEYANHFFSLLHELEEAVVSPVDLLTPGGITRPSLARNIREQGIVLYEA